MARTRNVKPAFFLNTDLSEVPALGRLAFIGMWTIADYKGCIELNLKKIKAQILPYDECNFEELMNNLEQYGFIRYYSVQGKKYIKIVNFEKHQNPHKNEREAGSDIPDEDGNVIENSELKEDGTKTEQELTEDGTTRALSLKPHPLNLTPSTTQATDVAPVAELVNLYHECMPDNPKCKVLNDARRRLIKARWNESKRLDVYPFGFNAVEEGLVAWRKFFEICNESLFLTGKSKPKPGQPPFLADIDFIFSPSAFAKTLENKYHRDFQE